MARHLATVHLPLYLGAVGVLVTSAVAWVARNASWLALAGATLSVAAEAWHAYSHLRMDTHAGPIAGSLSFVGFLAVVTAMWISRRPRRNARATRSRRIA
jgi:hypothetical protein